MIINPSKTAFGRHETFALRYGWLTKGFSGLLENPGIFESDDATVVLGVGKNMVNSIRYWLRAFQMIEQDSIAPTLLGKTMLDPKVGYDPYLEDEATIWLLHWLLASNAELATSWFWFFNKFHSAEFTAQEVQTALSDFVKERIKHKVAASTVKSDSNLVLRMYTQSKIEARTPIEEALDSPLSLLRLIIPSPGGRTFLSRPEARSNLPVGIFGFAIAQMVEDRKLTSVPIEELMYSASGYVSPGAVFRMTENDLLVKLETMLDYLPAKFEIRETAGIHQLYKLEAEITPMDYLAKHYEIKEDDVAA